jgi:hypothetical protein
MKQRPVATGLLLCEKVKKGPSHERSFIGFPIKCFTVGL